MNDPFWQAALAISSLLSGYGQAVAALVAIVAIPIALVQQRNSRISARENNTFQILLSYIEARKDFDDLEIVKSDPRRIVSTTEFHEEKLRIRMAHATCGIYAICGILKERKIRETDFLPWSEIILSDLFEAWVYVVAELASAYINEKRWLEKIPRNRWSAIETIINSQGYTPLMVRALEIQRSDAFKTAPEEETAGFRALGQENVETLVAFWVDMS